MKRVRGNDKRKGIRRFRRKGREDRREGDLSSERKGEASNLGEGGIVEGRWTMDNGNDFRSWWGVGVVSNGRTGTPGLNGIFGHSRHRKELNCCFTLGNLRVESYALFSSSLTDILQNRRCNWFDGARNVR
jgi:hypothetical protein